jgi:hypothetical protein
MPKVVGTFIKEMPLPIQEKAKEILVFCKNGVVRFNRKKSQKKRV